MTLNTTAGSPDADSYVTLAEFKAHADSYGYDVGGSPDDAIEQACRRGTRWIDVTYGYRFIGEVVTVEQSLEWPRIKAVWRGQELDSTTIPKQIKNAACEAVWRELNNPNSLSPDYVQAEAIKQEQVGDLSVTYQDGKGSVEDVTPIVSIIDNLLAGFIAPSTKGALFGPCARS